MKLIYKAKSFKKVFS